MDDLYSDHKDLQNLEDPSSSFAFDNELLKKSLRSIYSKDFDPMNNIEENLFNATLGTFNLATDKGFSLSQQMPPDGFINAIKYNNAVFAAFRTHRMQNDMAKQLLDADGKLKPFGQFAKDVAPIADHHVNNWLRTEYDTAVLRAHHAANWLQYEKEKDVLPNLEWMPSLSVVAGEDHRIFWGTILPVNHPFWKSHRPGDRWNCKCPLQATDKPATSVPQGKEIALPSNQPAKGLENNPATDGQLFSFAHPFFTAGYMAYNKLAPIVDKFVDKQLTLLAAKNIRAVKRALPQHNGLKIIQDNFITGSMTLLRRSLDDVMEHNSRDKWLKTWLTTFKPEKIKSWKYEGWAENRPYHKDHPKYDSQKPNKKKHPEAEFFTYYSFKMNGIKYYANVKLHKNLGAEVLYTIERKVPKNLIDGRPDGIEKYIKTK